MVRMELYKQEIEDKYWECVENVIDIKMQRKILESCRNYLPPNFFAQNASFRELVLAPYAKLKEAYQYIEENRFCMEWECFQRDAKDKFLRDAKNKLLRTQLYEDLYKTYEKVSQKMVDKVKMNVFLVRQTGITVCPYCNRDYINCRSEKLAGAQLDHFFPRSQYPIFSVCLYNLVPVCGNCNHIKRDGTQEFASPFDEEIDWEHDIQFSYEPLDLDRRKIVIHAKGAIKNNIDIMHIETAYQIHDMEVNELLDKAEKYSRTQLEEYENVFAEMGLSKQELKQMVFGKEITEDDIRKKPLGRMLRDLERELKIYK